MKRKMILFPFHLLLLLYITHSSIPIVFSLFNIPENNFKGGWLLIQIKCDELTPLKIDSKHAGDYHSMFIPWCLDDSHLCDETTRWWLLWHEYTNNKSNVPIYDARMLCGPKRKPDPNKYILWTDSIDLTDPSSYLYSTFHFNSRSHMVRQYIKLTHWE